jgi:hypothetical protein
VRGDRDWWYEGSTHEYLTSRGAETVEPLDAIVVHHHADGGARADKFTRDRDLLERELLRDPHNERAAFYLAQTYRDLGDVTRAIELYERRALMHGWDEEVFYSLYQVGLLTARAGEPAASAMALIRAWQSRPTRAEPLYHLAVALRDQRLHEAAFLFSQRGVVTPQPDDILFVEPWIYRWGLLFEYSIAAYWTGKPETALSACDRLLAMPELPDAFRDQTNANREFCLQAIQRQRAPKLIVRKRPIVRDSRRG